MAHPTPACPALSPELLFFHVPTSSTWLPLDESYTPTVQSAWLPALLIPSWEDLGTQQRTPAPLRTVALVLPEFSWLSE